VTLWAGLPALARLAWRDTARHPGRSLLVAALLALPAAELASATVLFRYGDLKAGMTLGGSNVFMVLWLPTVAVAALTAAAAIGVGARRQLRDLGLLAATGADRWQLGAVVLLQGTGLGLLGGLAGIPLGLGATWAAFPVATGWLTPVQDEFGATIVPEFSVVGRDMCWVATFAVVVALLAAARPAFGAARLPVVAALAGRRPSRPARRRLVVAGLVVAAAGVALQSLAGYLIDGPGIVVSMDWLQLVLGTLETIPTGTAVTLAGAALCAPALVTLAGRAVPQRPAALRLAGRDAARHPGRSAPAVAAMAAGFGIMVVLAGAVPNRSYFNGYELIPKPLLWSPPFPVALRVLLAVFTVMTLAVVLCVNALGRVESRDDLAVLDALGASPGTRRALAAASAWLLTELGALVGAAAAVSLLVARRALLAVGLAWGAAPVPWAMLGLVLVVVPALAALAGAAAAGARPAPLPPRAT
jgi:hypothetical protein